MSIFWHSMFKALDVMMLIFTVYHLQTDSQSEQTNQIIEIVMWYYTAKDEKSWVKTLPYISFTLNNSLNTATECVLNKVNFGMKTKNLLTLMNILVSEEQKRLHSYQRKEVEESIVYANLMIKKYHDKEHKSIRFNINDKIYLNLHQGYKLDKNDSHCKLEVQCTGSHKMLKQVGNLIYQLKLSETM